MGTRALDLPPRAGWNWLFKGWTLFRKNPVSALVLTASYLGIVLFLMVLIPVLGALMVAVLSPGLNAGLMTGFRLIDRGLPVTPSVVLSPFFEENRRLAKPFLRLGAIYALAVIVVSLAGTPFGKVDMAQVLEPGANTEELAVQMLNMLAVMTVLYAPVMMLFWYAPALVLWHEIEPRKALFFSFVTVWRNRGAFLVYGMGWLLWVSLGVSTLSILLAMLPLPAFLAGAVNFVIILTVSALSMCTFYPSYIDVFEGHGDQ